MSKMQKVRNTLSLTHATPTTHKTTTTMAWHHASSYTGYRSSVCIIMYVPTPSRNHPSSSFLDWPDRTKFPFVCCYCYCSHSSSIAWALIVVAHCYCYYSQATLKPDTHTESPFPESRLANPRHLVVASAVDNGVRGPCRTERYPTCWRQS